MVHSHSPDPIENERKIIKNKVETTSLSTQDNLHEIYQEQINSVPSIILIQISKIVSKQLIKKQRKCKLTEPSCIDNFYPPLELRKIHIWSRFFN